MKLTHVSVTYSRKLNLGNYESVDASVFLSAEVNETDDLDIALDNLTTSAKLAVFQALESEMAEDTKVVFEQRIIGKKTGVQKVVSVNPAQKITNDKTSIWDKYSETDDDDIEF